MSRRRHVRRRRPHGPECRHCPRVRALGLDFAAWRAAWETARQAASCGYRTEETEWEARHPAPTFRRYLIGRAGDGWPMSGRAPERAA